MDNKNEISITDQINGLEEQVNQLRALNYKLSAELTERRLAVEQLLKLNEDYEKQIKDLNDDIRKANQPKNFADLLTTLPEKSLGQLHAEKNRIAKYYKKRRR